MEFKVIFLSHEGNPIDVESEELGMCGLIELRKKLHIFDIFDIGTSSERVNGIIPSLRKQIIAVILTEDEVYESGYFQRENSVYVWVPEGSLNQYTNRIIDIDRDDEGEIKLINIILHINTAKIVNDWKNAGYPIEWRGNPSINQTIDSVSDLNRDIDIENSPMIGKMSTHSAVQSENWNNIQRIGDDE